MPQPQPTIDLSQLIASLGEGLDLTGVEIADILWFTLQRQEFEGSREIESPELDLDIKEEARTIIDNSFESRGDRIQTELLPTNLEKKAPIYAEKGSSQGQELPLQIPDAPSLREPIDLARSLRPLMRRVFTGRMTMLDEVATVDRIAAEGIQIPVMQSEPEPWLDLALVIDESQSMLIWRSTIRDLQRLLFHYGIFRDIRVWGIKPDEAGEKLQMFSRMGSNQRIATPRELVDPTGRRLVLVVSDCVSNIWRRGIIFPALQEWTQKQPLAVVQMLPEWMWRRSALGLGTAVEFSSSIAGAANRELLVNKKFLAENRTKIPVLTLEPEGAAQWSQMLVGKADAVIPGYILPGQLDIKSYPQLQNQQQAIVSLDASQRVQRFRATTSPLGRKLAGLLAAAPFINLPVVRLIQQTLLPQSRSVQLAEVFLGGLLQPKSAIAADTNPDTVEYEFIALESRDILLEDSPVSDSNDVLNAVSRYVAQQMGKNLDQFRAMLKAPATPEGEQVKPFAELAARILRKLGGDYARLADELDSGIVETDDIPPIPPSVTWFDEEFETVTVAFIPVEAFSYEVGTLEVVKSRNLLRQESKKLQIKKQNQQGQQLVEQLGSGTTLEMVVIPAGKFIMGAPKEEEDSRDSERPQHEVSVSGFLMGKYPITQAQWRVVAGMPQIERELKLDPSRFKGNNLPVEQVSWLEAVEFCARLSIHSGREYKLPSEAEWEYGCRAMPSPPAPLPKGEGRHYPPFHFGETITTELVNYNGDYPYGEAPKSKARNKTTSVGSFPANAFGLYDMHGNVWEWCEDDWHSNYTGAPEDGSAWMDNDNHSQGDEGIIKLLRGGSWVYPARFCRSAVRSYFHARGQHGYVGFRVVCRLQ